MEKEKNFFYLIGSCWVFLYRKILVIHISEKEQTSSKHYISLHWKEVGFTFWKQCKRKPFLTEIIEYIYEFIKWSWELYPALQHGPLKILPFPALARVPLLHRALECIRTMSLRKPSVATVVHLDSRVTVQRR